VHEGERGPACQGGGQKWRKELQGSGTGYVPMSVAEDEGEKGLPVRKQAGRAAKPGDVVGTASGIGDGRRENRKKREECPPTPAGCSVWRPAWGGIVRGGA